jgi:hypothetical protein
MPVSRTLLVFFVCASLAGAAELRTLSGKTITGEVESVNAEGVTLLVDGKKVETPLADVLLLDLGRAVKPPDDDAKYHNIRLLDETLFHCGDFTIKKKEVEATLLSGQKVKFDLDNVVTILVEANNPKYRASLAKAYDQRLKQDQVLIRLGENLNPVPGTLGLATPDGKDIAFRTAAGVNKNLPIANLHGMVFFRPNLNQTPPICQVYDVAGNQVMASKIVLDEKNYQVTTPAGIKLTYEPEVIAKFDYNMGKLTYLSDMTPVKQIETSASGLIHHYRKDLNLDGQPIRLKDQAYAKGLSMHAHTELEYDLAGRYKDFRAILGVDDQVGGDSKAIVTIECDGAKVAEFKASRAALHKIALDVRKINRLRIIVSSNNFLDLHDHVTLADAKVSQ